MEQGSAASQAAREEFSYEMLQELLRAERRSNKLSSVPPRFWSQVRDFLQARMDAFRVEQAKDPFSRRVMVLTDEVKNAKHAAESLWAIRERKLAMLALASGKDRRAPDGVTPDEGALFQELAASLDAARTRTFEGLLPSPGSFVTPPRPSPPAAPAPAPAAPTHPAAAPAPVAARPVPPAAPAPAAPTPVAVPSDVAGAADLVTIRALGDIPPFVGPDMQTYLLKAGDVATVPKSIANLLTKRQKAALVEGA